MKLIPFYSQTMDMIVKTFLNNRGLVRTVIYELPRHEAVNKYTKMTLVEENGYWYVVAYVFPGVRGEVKQKINDTKNEDFLKIMI